MINGLFHYRYSKANGIRTELERLEKIKELAFGCASLEDDFWHPLMTAIDEILIELHKAEKELSGYAKPSKEQSVG